MPLFEFTPSKGATRVIRSTQKRARPYFARSVGQVYNIQFYFNSRATIYMQETTEFGLLCKAKILPGRFEQLFQNLSIDFWSRSLALSGGKTQAFYILADNQGVVSAKRTFSEGCVGVL